MQRVLALWAVLERRRLHLFAHKPEFGAQTAGVSALYEGVLSAGAVVQYAAYQAQDALSVLLGGILSEWKGASAGAG